MQLKNAIPTLIKNFICLLLVFLVFCLQKIVSVSAGEPVSSGGFTPPEDTTIVFEPYRLGQHIPFAENVWSETQRCEQERKQILNGVVWIANEVDDLWVGDNHRFTVISGIEESFRWYSSNPEVAVINPKTGELTALKRGQTNITVIGKNGKKDSYLLKVLSYREELEVREYWEYDNGSYFMLSPDVEWFTCDTPEYFERVQRLHLPEGVKGISDCLVSTELKEIRIPASVGYIGCTEGDYNYYGIDHASGLRFSVSGNNQHYYSLLGGLFSYPFTIDGYVNYMEVQNGPATLLAYEDREGREVYYVPYGVEKIGDKAFYETRYLRKVVLPPTVTTIGIGAFLRCNGIEEIVIPASVTEFQVHEDNDEYTAFGEPGYSLDTAPNVVYGDNLTLKTLTIVTPKGSAAEAYAIEYGIRYRNE